MISGKGVGGSRCKCDHNLKWTIKTLSHVNKQTATLTNWIKATSTTIDNWVVTSWLRSDSNQFDSIQWEPLSLFLSLCSSLVAHWMDSAKRTRASSWGNFLLNATNARNFARHVEFSAHSTRLSANSSCFECANIRRCKNIGQTFEHGMQTVRTRMFAWLCEPARENIEGEMKSWKDNMDYDECAHKLARAPSRTICCYWIVIHVWMPDRSTYKPTQTDQCPNPLGPNGFFYPIRAPNCVARVSAPMKRYTNSLTLTQSIPKRPDNIVRK